MRRWLSSGGGSSGKKGPPSSAETKATAATKKTSTTTSKKVDLTRKQVEYLSEKAKAEQKFWDMLVPERGLSGVGIALLAVVVTAMHFYNGQKDDERAEQEREEARLERAAAARRKQPPPLTPEQRRQLLSFKSRQESQFSEKLQAARADGDAAAVAAAEERLEEIRARLAELRAAGG